MASRFSRKSSIGQKVTEGGKSKTRDVAGSWLVLGGTAVIKENFIRL